MRKGTSLGVPMTARPKRASDTRTLTTSDDWRLRAKRWRERQSRRPNRLGTSKVGSETTTGVGTLGLYVATTHIPPLCDGDGRAPP